MKSLSIIFIVSIFSLSIYGQTDTVKQITDFNFDSRNPVFLQSSMDLGWYGRDPELFFEAVYNDSTRLIYSLKYDVDADSFYKPTRISSSEGGDSNFICRNAAGKFIDYYNNPSYNFNKILLWETNVNGNWDIVFTIDSGTGWTPPSFLFDSQEDELHPSLIIDLPWYFYTHPERLLYSRGNSVLLHNLGEGSEDEILFQGNDSIKYSNPTGAFWDNQLYVVAVQQSARMDPHIVFRSKGFEDTSWSRIQTIFDRAPTTSPKFTNPDYGILLSFQVLLNGKKKVLLIRPEDFGKPGTAFPLLDDPAIETSDFSAIVFDGIVTRPQGDYYSYYPYTFKYIRNDSAYIRVTGEFEYYYPFIDVYTRVTEAKPTVGWLGYKSFGYLSYTIWEDSSNNRINLFGVSRIDPWGDVNDPNTVVKDFILLQNYPNPFNPTTNIGFKISDFGSVTLKIYNVLGKEVRILVDEERPAGNYEVEFDATNLPSGIYFYQLKAGDFIQTKKMILLR